VIALYILALIAMVGLGGIAMAMWTSLRSAQAKRACECCRSEPAVI
jgi:hypothetical protein